MSVTVYSFKTVDVNEIQLSVPVKYNNKYSSYTVYNDDPLFIQTPKIKLHEINSDFEYIFEITESPEFISLIDNIESKIIDIVFINSEKWFKKEISRDIIQSRLQSLLSRNENKTFLKVPFESKSVSFFNQYKTIIDKDELVIGTLLTLILKFSSVTFFKLNFQYDLILEQGKVYQEQFLKEYSIIDSDDNSEDSSELSDLDEDCQTYIPEKIIEDPALPFF
jgi:hypothetical protein